MAYLGNTPTTQNFVSGTDYFNGTGSQTAFTLSRTVNSINDIQAVVNNVVQQPNDAYTLSGTTITFTSAPSSGTNNVYVRYLSTTTQVITPSQNSVGTAQLGTITNIASGNSSLTLQTGSTPTTAVTIDTSQNVGIGTSSPSEKLSVTGNVTATGTNTSATYFHRSIAPATESNIETSLITTGNGANQRTGLFATNDYNNTLATELIFKTNATTGGATERMRITSGGYVGIGTTTPDSYGALAVRKGVNGTWLGVSGNSSFQTSDAQNSSLYVVHSSANSGTTFIGTDAAGRLQMFCSSSASGGVYLANGGTSWTSASDERVKENLEPIQNGLEKVTSLRTVTGNYIADKTKKSKAFLIAQDVEAVLPEAVDSSNPDELGLAYTDVIPLLVASIKELKAELDATKAEVQALKGVA